MGLAHPSLFMVPPEDGAECPKWVPPSGRHHDRSPARGSLPRFSSPKDSLSAIRRPLNALPITGVAHFAADELASLQPASS